MSRKITAEDAHFLINGKIFPVTGPVEIDYDPAHDKSFSTYTFRVEELIRVMSVEALKQAAKLVTLELEKRGINV